MKKFDWGAKVLTFGHIAKQEAAILWHTLQKTASAGAPGRAFGPNAVYQRSLIALLPASCIYQVGGQQKAGDVGYN